MTIHMTLQDILGKRSHPWTLCLGQPVHPLFIHNKTEEAIELTFESALKCLREKYVLTGVNCYPGYAMQSRSDSFNGPRFSGIPKWATITRLVSLSKETHTFAEITGRANILPIPNLSLSLQNSIKELNQKYVYVKFNSPIGNYWGFAVHVNTEIEE